MKNPNVTIAIERVTSYKIHFLTFKIPFQDKHIELFQKTLLELNKMKRGKRKMMIEIKNN